MTRHRHSQAERPGRRFQVVMGLVSGSLCLAALLALHQFVLAVDDARAYSATGGRAVEMTVVYAGLEAPLPQSHPGIPPPGRLCIVALADGTSRYAARLNGRACDTLQAGHQATVLTWRGRVIAVNGWATGGQPEGEVVAWAVATAILGWVALILTAFSVRAAGNRRSSWYYDRLEK